MTDAQIDRIVAGDTSFGVIPVLLAKTVMDAVGPKAAPPPARRRRRPPPPPPPPPPLPPPGPSGLHLALVAFCALGVGLGAGYWTGSR